MRRFDVTYIPDHTAYIASMRLAELSRDERWAPVATLLNEALSEQRVDPWAERIAPNQIEQASFVFYQVNPGLDFTSQNVRRRTILRLVPIADFARQVAKWMPEHTERDASGRMHLRQSVPYGGYSGFALLGNHTIVFDHVDSLTSLLAAEAEIESSHISANGQILLIARPTFFNRIMKAVDKQIRRDSPFSQALSPQWNGIESASLTIRLEEVASLVATAQCESKPAPKQNDMIMHVLLDFVEELLRVDPRTLHLVDPESRLSWLLATAFDEARDSAQVSQQGQTMTLSARIDAEKLSSVLAPTERAGKVAAQSAQSINNLKQIVRALVDYQQVHRRFPPAVLHSSDKNSPYSWRVAILPFLGHQELYDAYRLDEPWDGPNNRYLLARIPAVYRHPNDPADSTTAAYFAITGPETGFSVKEGPRFKDIIDGAGSTLMIAESKRFATAAATNDKVEEQQRLEIPWTRPDMELVYRADKPVGEVGLGGFFEGGFCAVYYDGFVRFVPNSAEESLLRAMLTNAAREPIGRKEMELIR